VELLDQKPGTPLPMERTGSDVPLVVVHADAFDYVVEVQTTSTSSWSFKAPTVYYDDSKISPQSSIWSRRRKPWHHLVGDHTTITAMAIMAVSAFM